MLVGTDGAVYAAHFQRPGGKAWFLTLPSQASMVDWVEAAVSHWHSVDSKRFPGTLDWTNQGYEWMTPHEVEAANAAIEAGEAKEKAGADEKAAWERFREAREVARSGPLRLLTEQGEVLSGAFVTLCGRSAWSFETWTKSIPVTICLRTFAHHPWIALNGPPW